MKKQPELTALTKKTLIDTYFNIRARGEKVTVEAITKQAGYNRCTFYRYFADTEQLLHQTESEICNAFQGILSQYPLVDSPYEIIESIAAVYNQYGDYLSVLLGRYGDTRFINKMKAIVYPMARQLFAPISDSDILIELKIEFVLSAVLTIVTKWYDMQQPISALQLGMLISNVLQKGVFHNLT